MNHLLETHALNLDFAAKNAINNLNLTIKPGQRIGLIGESGSGKSVTALAIMGLLPPQAKLRGSIKFNDEELVGLAESNYSKIRGSKISMIFQEPLTALDPTMKVGRQLAEVIRLHQRSRGNTKELVLEMLREVSLSDPSRIAQSYPFQLSGGQRQRVLIAMALANQPQLLICDEPTTALDVTVQAKILDLIKKELDKTKAACLFITHDLSVVAKVCDYLLVMYQGRIVEEGNLATVLTSPQHPYTAGLLATANIQATKPGQRLKTLSDFWQG